MKIPATFSELLQAYFTEYLMRERNASPHTIANYRDTFRMVIAFAQERWNKPPTKLAIADLDAPFVAGFLDHLEKDRGVSPRSRNVRLAAIHSFFNYVALQEPAAGAVAQRILAIKSKRCTKKPMEFLTRPEIDALLAAPDQTTWSGRRDRTLLLVAVQTGLRVSELIGLCCQDVILGSGAHVRCTGKGRKTRCIPLRKEAVTALRHWMREQNGRPTDPLFPNMRGRSLSRDGVEYMIAKHAATAKETCPLLKTKRVSPHVLRHSTAMDLLQHGVDRSVIALWLGHESMDTTQAYLHANLALKEQALAKTEPFKGRIRRYRPADPLLAFLQSL
ncbi:MAG: site-specific integrase [Verrucomicrobiota bacterium]|jgi:site-specific recombinase XerD